MAPKLKAYLLTYLGWFIGAGVGTLIAYFQMAHTLHSFANGQQITGILDLVGYGLIDVLTLSFSILLGLMAYQIITLVISPLMTYLLLKRAYDRAAKTSFWLFLLTFINPIFLMIGLRLHNYRIALYPALLWIFITPFLARYLATKLYIQAARK